MGVLEDLAAEIGVDSDTLRAALVLNDQAESLQPNYLTLGTDGSVGANFSGHLKAKGVDLTAATVATPPADDEIRWLRASDGAVIAEIGAVETGSDELLFNVHRQAGSATGFMQLIADNASGAGGSSSDLTLTSAPTDAATAVTILAGTASTRKLLDGTGASSFMQLAIDGNRKANLSSKTITWPGASVTSNILTVTHGLGVAPTVVLANVGTGVWAVASVWNFTNTQFTCQLRTVDGFQPANTTTTQMPWLAIS